MIKDMSDSLSLCDPMDVTCQAPLSMGFSRLQKDPAGVRFTDTGSGRWGRGCRRAAEGSAFSIDEILLPELFPLFGL